MKTLKSFRVREINGKNIDIYKDLPIVNYEGNVIVDDDVFINPHRIVSNYFILLKENGLSLKI
jgi:hypothetical protein